MRMRVSRVSCSSQQTAKGPVGGEGRDVNVTHGSSTGTHWIGETFAASKRSRSAHLHTRAPSQRRAVEWRCEAAHAAACCCHRSGPAAAPHAAAPIARSPASALRLVISLRTAPHCFLSFFRFLLCSLATPVAPTPRCSSFSRADATSHSDTGRTRAARTEQRIEERMGMTEARSEGNAWRIELHRSSASLPELSAALPLFTLISIRLSLIARCTVDHSVAERITLLASMWRCRPQWCALTAPPPPASLPVIVRATVGHSRCASSLAACSCSGLNAATIAAADLARRTGARSFATEAARTPAKASQSRRAAKLAARASTPATAAPAAAATDAASAADVPADAAQAASESTTAEPSVLYSPLPKPRNNRASTEDLSRAQLLQLMQSLPSTYVIPDRKHMPSLEELTRALEAVQQYRRRYGRTRSLMGFREFGLCIDTLVWSTHKHAQLLAQQRDQQSTAAFQLGASASATHNVLQKLVKEAVTRGYLRGNLPVRRTIHNPTSPSIRTASRAALCVLARSSVLISISLC